ncbi:CYTH domain-containing protein [Rhizorhapis sp. SPR117]|uniref:CYTH domain-containing protein n=1 Tax=Rhizorhapis sp. SPR117 TaxID=2912611 RepID=UPI001F1AA899|nr:CYTH domain-containing protein [Rhizorhapis sp. SPR117]
MTQEIERKYLVTGNEWQGETGTRIDIVQVYLAIEESVQIRVRIIDGARAALTVKAGAPGLVRDEYEYAIPLADAQAMLALRRGSLIEKTRMVIPRDGLVWEIDAFHGVHEGLVLAEVELNDAAHDVPLPPWVGREVTDDARYYNAVLARNPISADDI